MAAAAAHEREQRVWGAEGIIIMVAEEGFRATTIVVDMEAAVAVVAEVVVVVVVGMLPVVVAEAVAEVVRLVAEVAVTMAGGGAA